VPLCPNCGQESPEGARFCNACGTLLATPRRETRRTVTVLFCDVAGSTALAEHLDPEPLRRLMDRYFDEMRAILERHGGTVEKFSGDDVMAVFGVPLLHDDDAARAVRAAIASRERLASLNEEFEREWGVRLRVRTGLNTGQVVAGDVEGRQRLVTGDAVNVAKRIQDAAAPDDILIGQRTHRLVQDIVDAELVEPLLLKGKSEPVPAWRLLELLPDEPGFRLPGGAPFVGRVHELALLEQALAQAVKERKCQLCTIVGPPGIGKSRLARELTAGAEIGARVLVGRCLPYGDGITYWPIADIVKQVAGNDPKDRIEELVAAHERPGAVGERIAAALGVVESTGPPEETFWAFRMLFEALAREQPLIVVVDDIHWAQPTLLDLLEYLVMFSGDAPMLLLCLARPDLLDVRPAWAAPRPNATVIPLRPLSGEESYELVERLRSEREREERQHLMRIVEQADGNPLFLEQLLALKAENGGELDVPPSIQALLAARIDRLPASERTVIECASVEGRSFHRSAVSELLPEADRADAGTHLMSLVRKEFIRPGRTVFERDDAFRFVHILIRDAAYEGMPKQLRAELHERFAAWLERTAGDRTREYEEVLGYHLERAFRLSTELGLADDRAQGLARRAARRLGASGERARLRTDAPAAVNLLSRASSLLAHDDPAQLRLLPSLGDALAQAGNLVKAEAVFADAIATARVLADQGAESRATVEQCGLKMLTERGPGGIEDIRQTVEHAISRLESLGDERGLARAWRLLGNVLAELSGPSDASRRALERALDYARRTDDEQEQAEIMFAIDTTMVFGRTPAGDAIRAVEQTLEWYEAKGLRRAEARALGALAHLMAMRGRFDQARELLARQQAIIDDLGQRFVGAAFAWTSGAIEMLAGDPEAAERELRPAYESLRTMGAEAHVSVWAGALAAAVYEQGRYEEAERWAKVGEEAAVREGSAMETGAWRSVLAKVLARRGQSDQAVQLAREGARLLEQTDEIDSYAGALTDLGEVLRLAGRADESSPALHRAVELYEQKGNIVSAARARTLLAGETLADV
jgi:predicted ATPase/class 3 adenylate cyclase